MTINFDYLNTMGRGCFWRLSIICILFVAHDAKAQDEDALSIEVGDADLTPVIRIDYLSNSNAFLTPDNEVDTTGLLVSPSVSLRAERRLFELELGYRGAFADFSEDALDYDDHTIYADADAELDARRRLSGSFSIANRHEELGRNFTQGEATAESEQVEFIDASFDGNFTYGAETAQGNVTAGLQLRSVTYQTREDITEGDDFTRATPYARFSYRLSVDTRALIELRFSSIDFDNDASDRFDTELLAGLAFRGTGRTGGEVKVGAIAVNADDDSVDDRSIFSANMNLFYLPTTFSRLDLNYTRSLDNASSVNLADGGEQTIADVLSLAWRHQWSAFVVSRAILSLNNQNKECPDNSTTSSTGAFELGVKPRRWIEMGAGLQASRRTADLCPGEIEDGSELEFDRQNFNVYVRVTL